MHARIRFFESLLHLAYKIPLQKWQAQSDDEKKIVKEAKKKIQTSFKEELGLQVDIPKAGFGNTNDVKKIFFKPGIIFANNWC